jgi:hypothetical protein
MRIIPAAPVPARPTSMPGGSAPAAIVCAALMLALFYLAFEIAGVLSSSFPDCSFIGDSVDDSRPIPEIRTDHTLS